jgi:hypothetical protein
VLLLTSLMCYDILAVDSAVHVVGVAFTEQRIADQRLSHGLSR